MCLTYRSRQARKGLYEKRLFLPPATETA
jgi:hypothetical protein